MSRLHADLERQAAELRLQRAETAVEAAVEAAMRRWLETMRFLIISEAANQLGVTAAAGRSRHRRLGKPGAGGIGRSVTHPQPVAVADPPTIGTRANPETVTQAATGAYNDWARTVDDDVLPAVSIAFGEGFRAQQRSTPGGSFRSESEYMQTVHDRFKIWPQGAFEEVRPELVEALAEAETIEQITDRVGMVLGIDKDQRAIKARINEVEDRLKADGLDKAEIKALRAERRRLWEAHDAEETQWRWKARRIARTEAHGAVGAGQIAAARRRAAETGEVLHKRWLATEDGRTRMSHRIADGQIVGLDEKFVVDGHELDFPGDPVGPGHLSINCRCSMRIEDPVTLQEQLHGPDGSMGEIRPGGVRLGPDDPADIARAIEALSPPPSATGTEVPRPTRAQVQQSASDAPDAAAVQAWLDAEHQAQSNAGIIPADLLVGAQPGGTPVDSTKVLGRNQLEEFQVIAPDTAAERGKYFDPSEVDTASWLASTAAVQVQSVNEMKKRKTPDAVVSGGGPPLEFKALHPTEPIGAGMPFSHLSFIQRVNEIAIKSRRGVVDTRRTNATMGEVRAALEEAIRSHGVSLDEVVAIVRLPGGNDVGVSWRRGIS